VSLIAGSGAPRTHPPCWADTTHARRRRRRRRSRHGALSRPAL